MIMLVELQVTVTGFDVTESVYRHRWEVYGNCPAPSYGFCMGLVHKRISGLDLDFTFLISYSPRSESGDPHQLFPMIGSLCRALRGLPLSEDSLERRRL